MCVRMCVSMCVHVREYVYMTSNEKLHSTHTHAHLSRQIKGYLRNSFFALFGSVPELDFLLRERARASERERVCVRACACESVCVCLRCFTTSATTAVLTQILCNYSTTRLGPSCPPVNTTSTAQPYLRGQQSLAMLMYYLIKRYRSAYQGHHCSTLSSGLAQPPLLAFGLSHLFRSGTG